MQIKLTFIHPIHTLHEWYGQAGIKTIHFTDEIINEQDNENIQFGENCTFKTALSYLYSTDIF